MPQIPYSPVPSIAPSESATPGFRLNVPEGAFGGGVAAATEGLGGKVSEVGNELFGRAVALQQLNNESEARDADTKYMMTAGELHAKYNALEGKDRVDAFPQYSKDLAETRTKLRDGLSNQMAQKMYDASSLSTMGRSIFNGAGAAASANKEWAHGAVTAQHDLIVKQVYDDPNDESAFRQAIKNNHDTATSRAALTAGGASPERVELITKQGDSTIAANRVLGMARNQPYQASQLLKKYKDEGLLFGKEAEVVENKVQSLTQTVGADTIAGQTLGKYLQPDGTYSKSSVEMQAEAVDVAKKAYPDDPKMETAATTAFDRKFNQHSWAMKQDQQQVTQQLNTYITKGVRNTDMLPPDLLKQMTPGQIKAFPAQANTYQKSIDTQTNQDAYEKFLGLYNNDNGKFMETDFMAEPGLNKSDRDRFLKLQRQANANGDPRVAKAIQTLRGSVPGTLESLGIYRRDTKNPEDYDRFTGALHEAIQSYQETNGKPPNEQALSKEIFPNLIMQVTDPDRWFGRKSELFRAGVPDEVKAAAEKDAGKPLNEEEVRKTYMRMQFNDLFSKKKAAAGKTQGRVGE